MTMPNPGARVGRQNLAHVDVLEEEQGSAGCAEVASPILLKPKRLGAGRRWMWRRRRRALRARPRRR